MPARSILRAKPLRHPQLDLCLLNQFAAIGSIESLLDSLLNVDVVLDVLQRHLIGQFIKETPDRFFSVFHGAILSFGDHRERSVGAGTEPSIEPPRPARAGRGWPEAGWGASQTGTRLLLLRGLGVLLRLLGLFLLGVVAFGHGVLLSRKW